MIILKLLLAANYFFSNPEFLLHCIIEAITIPCMRIVILSLLGLSILFNTGQLVLQILHHQHYINDFHPHNLGDQFQGLQTVFGGVPRIGYYTDKNIEEPAVIAQFEQAQYHLAPTILDLNHTHYALVILDCSSPRIAFEKIKELKLQPIKINNQGVIIAINPKIMNPNP